MTFTVGFCPVTADLSEKRRDSSREKVLVYPPERSLGDQGMLRALLNKSGHSETTELNNKADLFFGRVTWLPSPPASHRKTL